MTNVAAPGGGPAPGTPPTGTPPAGSPGRTARGDRWAAGLALVGLGFATVPIAARILTRWVPREDALDLGPEEARALLAERSDAGVVLLLAMAGWLALGLLRRRATDAHVARALRRGAVTPSRSPVFPYTLGICALWLLAASVALAWLALFVAADDDLSTVRGLLEHDHAGLAALALAAVPVAALVFAWRYRGRRELPHLERAGLIRVGEPPPATRQDARRLRLRVYVWGVVVEALFFAFALLGTVLPGGERPTADEVGFQGLLVVAGPGFISMTLLFVLLLLPGTHWVARACLRRPAAFWAVVMILVGFLANPYGPHLLAAVGGEGVERYETAIAVVSVGLALGGLVMASFTSLYVMDLAAQPWLGLLYLAFAYFLGYFTSTDAEAALPSSPAAWIGAVVALGYVLHEGRGHWRQHAGVRPAAAPAP